MHKKTVPNLLFFVQVFFQNLLTGKNPCVSIETDQRKTPNKEGTKMTKKEMVKELLGYGVIAEADRAHVMKMTKARIKRIYKEALPIRKAYLERKG